MSRRPVPSNRPHGAAARPLAALALAALALAAGACRPESSKPEDGSASAPGGAPAATGTGAPGSGAPGTTAPGKSGPGPKSPDGPARARPPAPPSEPTLPAAPPLSKATARAALSAAAVPDGDFDLAVAAMEYLADSGDADEVRAAAAKLLVRGEGPGGWDDVGLASAALTALFRIGDADTAAKILALGRDALEADEVEAPVVDALAAVAASPDAARAAEARALLAKLTQDPFFYGEAIAALAEVRGAEGRERFQDVATDAEEDGTVRASAVAGLLAIGDPRGPEIMAKLADAAAEDVAGFEIVDGLGIRGVADGVETIRRLVRTAVEDENSALEIRSAAAALLEIRGAGQAAPGDLEFLRGLLGLDDGLSDEHVHVALWALGDPSHAPHVAKALTRWVVPGSPWFDPEEAVWVLDLVGERREGGSDVFSKLVDSAAAIPVPSDPMRPDLAAGAKLIRLAAARARLR